MLSIRAGRAVFPVLFALAASVAAPLTEAQGANEPPSLAPMLEKVLPGVVSIAVSGRVSGVQNPLLNDPFFRRFFNLPQGQVPQQRKFQAAGSGVIVDAEHGYILTNDHLVEKADEITVVLADRREVKADVVGTDSATDLAVVRVDAANLHALPFGDSDALRVGDYVVAVGNPFGLEQTVTMGIVSALGRTGLGIEGYESFIQTDASINPGNSGGALVNLNGELIGINSAIIGPSGGNVGIGFAIPVNMARAVMDQLIAYGAVRRGQLGVRIQDLTPDLAVALGVDVQTGAVVAGVVPDSPAEKAQIEPGDVIVAVDGAQVHGASDLRNKVGLAAVGSQLTLTIVRKGAKRDVAVTLEAISQEGQAASVQTGRLAGLELGPIPSGSPIYGRADGALVTGIEAGSAADRAGLRVGDVIVAIDQKPVHGPDDVITAAEAAGGRILLQVMRDDAMFFVVLS